MAPATSLRTILVTGIVVLCAGVSPRGDAHAEEDGVRTRIRQALVATERLEDAGRDREARDRYRELATHARAAQYLPELEFALHGRVQTSARLYDYEDMRQAAVELASVQRARGADERAAITEGDLGGILVELGDYRAALSLLGPTVTRLRDANPKAAVYVLTTCAIAHAALGAIAEALSCVDDASTLVKPGDSDAHAYLLNVKASLLADIGDHEGTLSVIDELISMLPESASRARAAALSNAGHAYARQGQPKKAREKLGGALKIYAEAGDPQGLAKAYLVRGDIWEEVGDPSAARDDYTLALRHAKPSSREAAWARQGLGTALQALEPAQPDLVRAHLRSAMGVAESLGDLPLQIACERSLATAHLRASEMKHAREHAHRALDLLDLLDTGLADSEAAFARENNRDVFDTAIRVALAEPDPVLLYPLIERCRASVLAEALGGGAGLSGVGLDDRQRVQEQTARQAVVSAQRRFTDARRGGDRKAARDAREQWRGAREAYRSLLARLERQVHRVTVPARVSHAPLAQVQASLSDGDVLVLYTLLSEEAGALVIAPDAARWCDLEDGPGLLSDCAALVSACAEEEDTAPIAERLAKGLLRPLQLPAGVERILISPDGPLAFVPFTYLLSTDEELPSHAEIALIPSATVYRLLRLDRSRRGKHFLLLGDPDYRGMGTGRELHLFGGGTLLPLPATRREVMAIKREGDSVYLGPEASERTLRAIAPTRDRWAAIHLACHGTVHTNRPSLSSLALTPSDEHDGFLTAAEILHVPLRTDLVVLSACESGLGRPTTGEGMMGLARAFMSAGAPRVIASLWPVDDDATAALMLAFYAAWRDGESNTAQALRRAQDTVRGEPGSKWHHAKYWAAWVLWGLPD